MNEWIRTSPIFDGVADFDKAVRDPQNPQHFAAQYDSGDHLHPKDAGYQAMAAAIDLSLFTQEEVVARPCTSAYSEMDADPN